MGGKRFVLLLVAAAALVVSGCSQSPQEEIPTSSLSLSSPAFGQNGDIPAKYTCQGSDLSPPLKIAGVPEGTKSLALVVDDPDAPMGTWDHWVVWNIPAATGQIAEGAVPSGAVQGRNGWGNNFYGGPCPPYGKHRYFFKLYALNTTLNLKPGSQKYELEAAMKGRIIGQAHLVGLYEKSQRV